MLSNSSSPSVRELTKSIQKIQIVDISMSDNEIYEQQEIAADFDVMGIQEPQQISQIESQSSSEPNQDAEQNYQLYKQLMKDLEFVQLLGDVKYLRQLHTRGYFYNDKFIEYIRNLASYIFLPQYIRMVRYPEGLWNLKTMLREGFIESTKRPETFEKFLDFCKKRNEYVWKGYR